MGNFTFKDVCARALEETKADVRLDKPVRIVTGLFAPFMSAGIVWWATQSIAWGGIAGVGVLVAIGLAVFIVKLVTVPLAMANEANEIGTKNSEVQGRKIEAMEAHIAALTAPPPRDPDGVYQHGRLVGKIAVASPQPQQGIVQFQTLAGGSEFHETETFEYRDFRLTLMHCATQITESGIGKPSLSLWNEVVCKIEGRF